jgi:hypothetical protein
MHELAHAPVDECPEAKVRVNLPHELDQGAHGKARASSRDADVALPVP